MPAPAAVQNLKFTAEWEDTNQSNESSTWDHFTVEWRGCLYLLVECTWWGNVPVMEGWGAPLVCNLPEAYGCEVQGGNMAEVEKVAALSTQLLSFLPQYFEPHTG